MKRIFLSLLICLGIISPAQSSNILLTGAGNSVCPQYGVFIDRTSGLDASHQGYYKELICGLVADGVWQKLDVLYVFATQGSGNAVLNLVSTSFTATANGTPTFTTDRGYTGVAASATVFIDTGYNASTAGRLYTQNSAHISAWCNANIAAGTGAIIGATTTGSVLSEIYPRYAGDLAFFRANDVWGGSGSTASANSSGHWIASRTGASTSGGYRNGSSFATNSQTSAALANFNIYVLTENASGVAFGNACQVSMASIGGSLSAADATKFYNRLRTYMTSVGVP